MADPWELYQSDTEEVGPWNDFAPDPNTDVGPTAYSAEGRTTPIETRQLPEPTSGYAAGEPLSSYDRSLDELSDMSRNWQDSARQNTIDEWARRRAENRPHFIRSLALGGSLGFIDEADAGLQALGTGGRNLMGRLGLGEGTNYTMGETYNAVVDANRRADQETRDRYPVTSFLTEVVGGIPTGGALFRGVQGAVGFGARGLSGVAQRAAPAVTEGAITGYGYSEGDVGDRLQGAAMGGALAGAGDMALRRLARGPSAGTLERTSAKRNLQDSGIDLTYGQMMGGGAQKVEDALATIPFLGDPISAARGRATRDLNTASINEALSPIGQALPRGAAGRGAIDDMSVRVGQAIEDSVSQATFAPDQKFAQTIQQLPRALTGLPTDTQNQISAIIQNDVLEPLAQTGGSITGRDLANMFSRLSGLRRSLGTSNDAAQREVGVVVGNLQDAILDTIERQGTGDVQAIRDARQAYALSLRPERAAGMLGAEGGVFTANQLQNAVRAMDTGVRNRNFARGRAPMQELSQSAVDIMGTKLPSSGTTERAAVTYALLGGGSLINPVMIKAVAGRLAMDAAYSAPTLKLMNAISKSKTKEALKRNVDFATKAAARNPELRDALSRLSGSVMSQQEE